MYDYLTISKNKGFEPITIYKLKEIFLNLGIEEGDVVMVHSSLSSLGYVVGGAEAIYEALIAITW